MLSLDDIAYDPEKDGEDDAADEDGYIEGFELVQCHVRTSPTDRAMKHAGMCIFQIQSHVPTLLTNGADNTMYWVLGKIRRSSTKAEVSSADFCSFTAMYLDKWDWHTGFNLEIKKDKEKPHKHGSN